MKLLILLSFLLGSAAAVAYPYSSTRDALEDNTPSSITTIETFPGIQESFVYRNNNTTQQCTTITSFPGVSNTYCN